MVAGDNKEGLKFRTLVNAEASEFCDVSAAKDIFNLKMCDCFCKNLN